jgi:hypothetical protein
MPKTKKTDLQVLRALLSLQPGKLSNSENAAFQEMYDKLATGFTATLSMKQRIWAHGVYDHHDLDKERPAARPVAIKDKSLLGHDFLGPVKPLKPPSRKPV